MTLKYLLLASFLFRFSYGSTRTFWSRRYHSSVIAGDWLYVDGGDVAYGGDTLRGDGKFDRENITYGLDLSKDWTNSSLNMIQTERPSDSPALNSDALWYDNKHNTIYCFGGDRSFASSSLRSLAPPPDSIWGFRPNGEGGGTWNQVLGPVSKPFPSGIHRLSSGASVSDGSSAYYLGGFGSGETSPDLSQPRRRYHGLLTFDFDTLTLTNSSDDGFEYGKGKDYHQAMINIPIYGCNGVLVVLTLGSFNNITLYDKKTKKRYHQMASGDIPQPRSHFCAVGIEGDEKPYFEIFIHGGVINDVFGSKTANSDQVYILSIPSFRWFQASYTPVNPRGGHTCQATNSGQMIMIGGQNPRYSRHMLGDGDAQNAPPDPWPQGIGVFDMTSLKFQDSYQAKAGAYKTPDTIKTYHSIDGNKYPSSWSSVAVKDIFEGNSSKPSNTTNQITSNPTVQPSQSSSPISTSPSRLRHSVIAGIVVGCTAAIVLVAVGATFMVKHGSTSTTPIDSPNEPVSTSPFEPPLGELPAERRPQEILNSYQDRSELPGTSRTYPIEISTSEPIIPELPTKNYRSRALNGGDMGTWNTTNKF